MPRSRSLLLLFLAAVTPGPAGSQNVVVDEGTFALTIEGRSAGEERFTIRRSGMGSEATIIAHGVVTLRTGREETELRPVLEALVPEGAASKYQLKVSGAETAELTLALAGRRFVSLIRTSAGEEEREFLARPETRILEQGVAHQYYFLRDAREASSTPAIEPRTRRQLVLLASAWTEEEIQVGPARVPARRVTFAVEEDRRTVWFDRQGRVLRVEIPARAYLAVRTDLVG